MESESPQSGFEELMRLSQQFTKQEQEHTIREQRRAEQNKKVQDVLGGLRELKLSVAIEQLRLVATPEIIERVNSLKDKPGTEELRAFISELADDLESRISAIAASNPDIKPIEYSTKTLAILMELFFSMQ